MDIATTVEGALRRYGPWVRTRAEVLGPALRTHRFVSPRPSRGNALVSYLTEAFERRDDGFRGHHSNLWECREMVRLLLELGYDVDVINFRNFLFTPRRPYDLVIDQRNNLERLAPLLGEGCTKIHHIETSHMSFQNAAEFGRLLDLQRRRGVALQPRRVERRVNTIVEHADLSVLYGGEHSARTWAYAGTPMYQVPGSPVREFPAPSPTGSGWVRGRFLFMGSGGLVLKGLDLVLEAFAGLPDHHLTVCGPIDREPDLAAAYHRELYETPNITTLGWVGVRSDAFDRLRREVVGLVYPSASESLSGVVVNAMHAGLVPVVTPECGVDVPADAGTVLREASVEAIRDAVRALSERTWADLDVMRLTAWEYARATHTRSRFSAAYRAVLSGVVGDAAMPRRYEPTGHLGEPIGQAPPWRTREQL